MKPTDILALSSIRSPMGSFGGTLKDTASYDIGAVVVRETVKNAPLK